ncbi:hypothetical protein DH2020_012293 [Rehmannia glutinosa]|uniref:Ribosomal RNA-processing protein 7 C-terminal domain-containing protein n=1 Tax=Rehmannia glutinosa TaxID=99300 RepID=A0ABR0X225_REHGL
MGTEDSVKKLKRKKNIKKKREHDLEMGNSRFAQKCFYTEGRLANEEDKKNNIIKKKMKKKRSNVDIANKDDPEMFELPNIKAEETRKTSGGNKKSKKLRNNKIQNGKIIKTGTEDLDTPHSNEVEDGMSCKNYVGSELAEDKVQKLRKKKRKNVESISKVDEFNEKDEASEQRSESQPQDHIANSEGLNEADTRKNSKAGKSNKRGKMKRKSRSVENEISSNNLLEKRGEDVQDEVYEMSSGDEDYTKGMKKWITQYHQSRPGIKVLQEKIDDFIMAHEAQEEQARVEREAQAEEGGWTVVVHHKGRKKTTEAETGIAVGSVAQAAVLDKMAKKKTKDVGIDFYRFQKRKPTEMVRAYSVGNRS